MGCSLLPLVRELEGLYEAEAAEEREFFQFPRESGEEGNVFRQEQGEGPGLQRETVGSDRAANVPA